MPVTILDGGSNRSNDSEYVLDIDKLSKWPDWLEEIDGYRDRFTENDAQVTRFYRCPWSKRDEAREFLLGYSNSIQLLGVNALDLANAIAFWNNAMAAADDADAPDVTNSLLRVIPVQDPERPWLFCSECEVQKGEGAWVQSPFSVVLNANEDVVNDPLTGDPMLAHAIHYVDNSEGGFAGEVGEVDDVEITAPPSQRFRDGKAVLRATFTPRDYTVLSDAALLAAGGNELRRYVSREEDFGIEALSLARAAATGRVLKFTEGPYEGNSIPEAGVKQMPFSTLSYTWHNVPDPPRTAYYGCVGRINAEPFDGLGGAPTYRAETLLCLPWKLKRRVGPTGRVQWTIQFRFSFRPQMWNRFPAGDGQFYKASWGGDEADDVVYEPADFNSLFQVAIAREYNR